MTRPLTDEELRARDYRIRVLKQIDAKRNAEARLKGNPQARIDLEQNWAPYYLAKRERKDAYGTTELKRP